MEAICCVVKEAQGEPDRKLKMIERPVEDGDEEEKESGGGGEEEEEKNGGRGDTVDDEDSEDDLWGYDEHGYPYLPYNWPWDDRVRICPEGQQFTMEEAEKIVTSTWARNDDLLSVFTGQQFTMEEAEEIVTSTWARNDDLLSVWCELANNNITPLPAVPLRVLPRVTTYCAEQECYHVRYWMENTSETASDHPYFIPCGMLQVFSLRLSSPLAHPINIYGHFSVRDGWEPLNNYLFKRSRDDPAMISQGCSFLPLRSPCRGIYVSQYFLMDVDLWIKEEEGSSDKLLFRGYVELNTSLSGFDCSLKGRFQGDVYGLDMEFAYLGDSIETLIEVKAEANQPSDMRISASTSGFDDEISLYDGKFCGSGSVFKHIVAVKKQGELHVVLKMDESAYKWTFKAGIGVIISPEHPVTGFTRYFVMNVSFRTRGKAASAWQWSCICNDVRVSKMCL